MRRSGKGKLPSFLPECIIAILACVIFLSMGSFESGAGSLLHVRGMTSMINDMPLNIVEDDTLNLTISALDEGKIVSYSSQGYRYGPSIIENEDGSYDVWFSAPGNNSTEWDYITYRHVDPEGNWSKEKVVLKPTPSSDDRCSVCDPGVIYFDGYYYLAYTSTKDYRLKGMNNSAFVARSKNPDGPFEKWNGKGWGGKPKAFITYEDDPHGWGIGEVSFVLLERDLYIYYTYFNTTGGYTALAKTKISENWPAQVEKRDVVIGRTTQDSFDVFYADDYKLFMAFTVENRMSEASELALYVSQNGLDFERSDSTQRLIEDYAHNMGIAKNKSGHQNSEKDILVGYAYGKRWGRWNAKFQHLNINKNPSYKVIFGG